MARGSLPELPSELWDACIELLPRRSLTVVATVCRVLQEAAEARLYRSIALGTTEEIKTVADALHAFDVRDDERSSSNAMHRRASRVRALSIITTVTRKSLVRGKAAFERILSSVPNLEFFAFAYGGRLDVHHSCIAQALAQMSSYVFRLKMLLLFDPESIFHPQRLLENHSDSLQLVSFGISDLSIQGSMACLRHAIVCNESDSSEMSLITPCLKHLSLAYRSGRRGGSLDIQIETLTLSEACEILKVTNFFHSFINLTSLVIFFTYLSPIQSLPDYFNNNQGTGLFPVTLRNLITYYKDWSNSGSQVLRPEFEKSVRSLAPQVQQIEFRSINPVCSLLEDILWRLEFIALELSGDLDLFLEGLESMMYRHTTRRLDIEATQ